MSVIPVIVRAFGIGLGAAATYLLMTAFDDGRGGANIGAGLAVFAVLAVGGFVWALFDGMDRRGSRAVRVGLGEVLMRWLVVSVLTVAIVVGLLLWRQGSNELDLDASSTIFLWILVLGPALVGALIGYSSRDTRTVDAGRTGRASGAGQTRSS